MLLLFSLGSVFFPGLFLLSKRCLKTIMGWRDGDAAVISTRLVSSVQAVMASAVGLVVVSSVRHVLDDRHWLADAYIQLATPYFVYDVYAMYLCHRHRLQVKGHGEGGGVVSVGGVAPAGGVASVLGFLRREKLMVLHHVFMVTCCCPASLLWRRGRGDYYQGLLFLAELSTPFVSLGKVLIQYHQQDSLLYRVNGLLILITFFSCRVLLFPFMYYSYSRYASIPLYQVLLVAPWQCNVGAALLWPLQLYWFTLICRAALRRGARGAQP